MKKKAVFFLLISVSFSACNNIAYSLTRNISSDNFSSLKETITALDVTRKTSKNELEELHKIQNTSLLNDINEYNIFIEYLSYQINTYCTEIYNNFGKDALTDLPCQINMNYNSGKVNTIATNKKIQTTEEQINTLDNEFLSSLGEFDEMLLKEEEQLAAKNRKNQNIAGSNGSFSNGNKQQNNNKEKSSDKKSSESGATNQTHKKEKNSQHKIKGYGKGNQQSSGKEKSNRRRKLDEIDDDIVARQLKEAAEKQTDPELKEKLWQEYYKYKEKTVN